ncbi:hypothetical protein PT974_02858 [Cladobotryum mycophilum]|uniref:C2H2-type domain-containing protein n=1 Tax=Cladobotryum mycophilum TaxID=491253 RepID=A0ABR0SZ81_9HYPO
MFPLTEVDSTLYILNAAMFVRASDVLTNIVSATKDVSKGKIIWITLNKSFHSIMLKTAVTAVRCSETGTHGMEAIKEAFFTFLLEILNGRPQADFFDKKKIEAKGNRANRERKRLARKRQRAAVRERKREASKLHIKTDKAGNPTGQTRTCKACETKFASRKTLSKHKCPGPKPGMDPIPVPASKGQTSEAKRARRRKAKKARKDRKKAKVAEQSVADNKLKADAPVTGGSGSAKEVVLECEGTVMRSCDFPAHGVIHHGLCSYPKCLDHSIGRSEFHAKCPEIYGEICVNFSG